MVILLVCPITDSLGQDQTHQPYMESTLEGIIIFIRFKVVSMVKFFHINFKGPLILSY